MTPPAPNGDFGPDAPTSPHRAIRHDPARAEGQRPDDQASRLRSIVQALNSNPAALEWVGAPAVPPRFVRPAVSVIHRSAPTTMTVTLPVRPPPRKAADPAATSTIVGDRLPPPRPAPRTRSCPVVAITSGKGGVGKTGTCVNLAIALRAAGHRVTVLDADLGLANADVLCGINPTTRLEAAVATAGDGAAPRSLAQIAVDAPGGFRLVPGSVGVVRMANLPPTERAAILDGLAELERLSDIVLIDTGAGLSDAVTSFVVAADLALVIATPEPTSIADAYAMIKCVAAIRRAAGHPASNLALVVNQAESPTEAAAVHERIASTCRRFLGLTPALLGVLHHDPAVPAAARSRNPFMLGAPSARISKDVRTLAAVLARELSLKTQTQPKPTKGLLGWLRSR